MKIIINFLQKNLIISLATTPLEKFTNAKERKGRGMNTSVTCKNQNIKFKK